MKKLKKIELDLWEKETLFDLLNQEILRRTVHAKLESISDSGKMGPARLKWSLAYAKELEKMRDKLFNIVK